ncbi:MAG: phenylalanine 4-monooxygenase [Saprospiraceae bacterium]
MAQDYSNYTSEDHKVWNLLFSKQIKLISNLASKAYLEGVKKCKFEADRVPNFETINSQLTLATGWKIYVVPGLIDNKPFFQLLSDKQFPATTWLRTMDELEYLEEPDMFHDVFGHVPLLSDSYFCKFLEGLSKLSLQYIENEIAVEYLARLYWYTVEFGLIKEENQLKIYGAGILSSSEESVYSVSDKPIHKIFDIDEILETPYIKDKLQAQYFVIDSYKQLYNSLNNIELLLLQKLNGEKGVAA